MTVKKEITNLVIESLESKRLTIIEALNDAQESANDSTKSSAGDKHETSRAMAQLEVERLGNQLKNIQKQLMLANSILHQYKGGDTIKAGSLIITEKQLFLILTGLGGISYKDKSVLVMAPNAPIAQQMLEKKVGDEITFMGRALKVKEVI